MKSAETSERQKFMESLRGVDPQLTEDLARECEEHLEPQRLAERQEQERAYLGRENNVPVAVLQT